jgi:hypothetical protein
MPLSRLSANWFEAEMLPGQGCMIVTKLKRHEPTPEGLNGCNITHKVGT